MNRFTHTPLSQRVKGYFSLPALCFILVITLFFFGVSNVSKSTAQNERKILEDALQRDIAHCYAIEGMYPPSLTYIQEHYGLTFDETKFMVVYETVGSNIMPTVRIIER